MIYKAAVVVVVLSCLLVAPSTAIDTYQTHLSFNASDMVMTAEHSCRSVVGTSKSFQHHVHVCENSNRVCFFTTMECCYGDGLPISSAKVTVDGKNVTVSFYTALKGTALCYSIFGNLESCNTKPECLQSCIPADPVCVNNTLNGLESCSDGACECMPGYGGPDCCECDLANSFFKFGEVCIPLCKASCEVPDVMGGCVMCRGDYSLPDCCQCRGNAISCDDISCECREGYGGLDCCECAPGYYRSEDGTCEVACTENTVNCTEGICICEDGYTGPGCCECDTTNAFVLYIDKCIPLCVGNCEVPDDLGGCTSCSGYYSLPDCCQCRGNAAICDDINGCTCLKGYGGLDCCECAPGYYRSEADGTCEVACTENTVNCTEGVCICKEGYSGPDCCECDTTNAFVLYIDKCIPLCVGNCEVPDDLGGCTSCSGYYSLPDCCQCRGNAAVCDDNGCTCLKGYGGLDCCECAPGYYRSEDGTCEAPCRENVILCTNGVCTCEEGYAGLGCCECDVANNYVFHLGKCKALCTSNCQLPNSNGGCVMCRGDYSLPDCCQCRGNAISCDDIRCECREGYGGLDCCECAPGYYRSEDGTCEAACVDNIISCANGTCVCKEYYSEVDCCKYNPPSCSSNQDIYFLIDTTRSFRSFLFCKMVHTVAMITKVISKGNNTRTGAYVYPQDYITTDEYEDMRLIDIEKQECVSAIEIYHDLVLQFSFDYDRGYASKVFASITLPFYVIDLLRRDILAKESSQTGRVKSSHRNVAILITDGGNDGGTQQLSTGIAKLNEETDTTVIAAGLASPYVSYNKFQKDLLLLTNGNANNVVSAQNVEQLNKGIVEKLIDNGVLCKDRGLEILKGLQEGNADLYCECNARRHFRFNKCRERCLPRKKSQCKQPPSCI